MIQFIIGEKGKGKTKVLLEQANREIREATGNVVYLDKNTQHMFELNNRIRLIDVTTYPLTDSDEFIGFLCGIISQDHDLETVFLDNFMKIARMSSDEDPAPVLRQIDAIGRQFSVNFVISISLSRQELPEEYRENITAEL